MQELIGQVLSGCYRVDRYVGRGGMAEVYRVWDQKRAVYLALKLLHHDLSYDAVFLRRFKREAQTLAKLQHPNIVRYYGLEHDDARAFMLMDYVEGHNLGAEIIRSHGNGGLSMDRVLQVIQPVCSALHYAHGMGMVHCDIKPANIMIHNNGTVMVCDFGISRHAEGATTATMVGAGTPAYMAPEQVRGFDPVPQTDIYALGIVLYEMLTGGERPFIGEMAAINGSITDKVRWEQCYLAATGLRRYNPAIKPEVEYVVLRCLEKEPAMRYHSAIDVYNALVKTLEREESITVVAQEEPTQVLWREEKPAWKRCENCDMIYDAGEEHCPSCQMHEMSTIAEEKQTEVEGETVQEVRDGDKIDNLVIAVIVGLVILLLFMAPEMFPDSRVVRTVVAPVRTKTAASTSLLTATSTLRAAMSTPVYQLIISEKDGVEMVHIPAGEFEMGSDLGDENEQPFHSVYLNAFWMDRYEVTNEQFEQCVAAGRCDESGYQDDNEFNAANQPVVGVSWYDAHDYCAWAGRRLSSEAEWEKAARGRDGMMYPWGNESPSGNLANYDGANDGYEKTSPVGSYSEGASPYGALDMAGNVWEWTKDWFAWECQKQCVNRSRFSV